MQCHTGVGASGDCPGAGTPSPEKEALVTETLPARNIQIGIEARRFKTPPD